jgi:hypothetical protein
MLGFMILYNEGIGRRLALLVSLIAVVPLLDIALNLVSLPKTVTGTEAINQAVTLLIGDPREEIRVAVVGSVGSLLGAMIYYATRQ